MPMKCFKDGRKICDTFIALPEWTNNWLKVCSNCPKGTGWSVDQAKSIEQATEKDDNREKRLAMEIQGLVAMILKKYLEMK